jgi:hypothetical protein
MRITHQLEFAADLNQRNKTHYEGDISKDNGSTQLNFGVLFPVRFNPRPTLEYRRAAPRVLE